MDKAEIRGKMEYILTTHTPRAAQFEIAELNKVYGARNIAQALTRKQMRLLHELRLKLTEPDPNGERWSK